MEIFSRTRYSKPVVNYNYIGMAGEPEVMAASRAAIDRYGTTVSASRVAGGEKPLHRELEAAIAGLLGVEDAVVMLGGVGVGGCDNDEWMRRLWSGEMTKVRSGGSCFLALWGFQDTKKTHTLNKNLP